MPTTGQPAQPALPENTEVAIIEPEGRLRIGDGDLALRDSIDRVLELGARRVLIDFRKTSRMDFSCLGELGVAKRKVDAAGGRLTLRNLPARVEEVIEVARDLRSQAGATARG